MSREKKKPPSIASSRSSQGCRANAQNGSKYVLLLDTKVQREIIFPVPSSVFICLFLGTGFLLNPKLLQADDPTSLGLDTASYQDPLTSSPRSPWKHKQPYCVASLE